MIKKIMVAVWTLFLLGMLGAVLFFTAIANGWIGYMPQMSELENPSYKFASQVISSDGKVLGRHKGIINYTVGQRRGLGIALGERMFVSAIDPVNNTVTLQSASGDGFKSAALTEMRYQLLPEDKAEGEHRVEVKIRYAAKPIGALLKINGDSATLYFDTPVKAVTPGQSAVMYRDGRVLCGGVIDSASV